MFRQLWSRGRPCAATTSGKRKRRLRHEWFEKRVKLLPLREKRRDKRRARQWRTNQQRRCRSIHTTWRHRKSATMMSAASFMGSAIASLLNPLSADATEHIPVCCWLVHCTLLYPLVFSIIGHLVDWALSCETLRHESA
jgi:hypothetical protein